MTVFDGTSADDFLENTNLLPPEEALDDDEVGEDFGAGYSPGERPLGVSAWGVTAHEESGHESLARRLAQEAPESDGAGDSDGLGDTTGTDGELIDDQVGDARSGRLILSDVDGGDPRSDYWATDAGIAGGGASAEEAAVHIVSEDASEY
jgi:hypothetical protein